MKKPKKLIPKSIEKCVKKRAKTIEKYVKKRGESMNMTKRDFGAWGRLKGIKYAQYTGKRKVDTLKKYEIFPPTQLISAKHLKIFRGLN